MFGLFYKFNAEIVHCLFPRNFAFRSVFDYQASNCYGSQNGSQATSCKQPLVEELAGVRAGEVKDAGKLVIPEGEISEEQVIESMLAQFDGICLADTRHEMPEPKQFLIDRMSYLKERGVTTIFMEHLFYETQQKTLDDYILNQDQDAKMPPDLEAYLRYLDADFQRSTKYTPGFKALVEKAKKERIRIVAIDTGPSYAQESTDNLGHNNYSNRGPALNHQTYAIVKTEIKKDEKYVVFCGAAHVINCKGVPGISQFLQIPNIFIEKSKNDSTNIQVNLEKHPEAKYKLTGFVHALIHRPQ